MNRFFVLCVHSILWFAALVLCKTLRVRRINNEFFENRSREKKPSVIAFWHGSMLLGWFLHRPKRNAPVSALVSRSTDGELLTTVLNHWGYTTIRGSSHVGGKEAVTLMINAVRSGSSLCITPDGSTGPRHQMKIGALVVAQQTHVPLILAGIAMKRKLTLRSWDKFEIPLPFSHVNALYGDPQWISESEGGEILDNRLLTIQNELEKLHGDAARKFDDKKTE